MADLSSTRPTPLAWLIGLAALALFSLAVYVGHNFVSLRRHVELRAEFLAAAMHAKAPESLVEDAHFDPILPRSETARRANVLKLVRAIQSVKGDDYAPASEILAEPRMQAVKNVKEVRADLAAIAGIEHALAKLGKADEELKRGLESASSQYRLQLTQLQQLLAYPEQALLQNQEPLPATAGADESDDEGAAEDDQVEDQRPMPFYSSGLLKDLPEIPGIPDNIPDLKSLAPLIQAQGSTLRSAPADFNARLEELRRSALALAERTKTLEARAYEQEIKAEQLEARSEQLKTGAQDKLKTALDLLITPPDDAERSRLDERVRGIIRSITGGA